MKKICTAIIVCILCLSTFSVFAPKAKAQPPIDPTITSVSFSQSASGYTITIDGNGFGSLPISLPFFGDTSYFRIGDAAQVGHAEWGYTGDYNQLNYETWTDTQIVISSFGGSSGDAVTIALWNPGTAAGATWGGNVPPVSSGTPQITSVTFVGNGQNLGITIQGSEFGNAPVAMPFTGDLNYFGFIDFRQHQAGSALFAAGSNGWGINAPNSVTMEFESWSDNLVQISGFAGTYGQGGATVETGDPVVITIYSTSSTQDTGPQTAWGGSVSGVSTGPRASLGRVLLSDNFTQDTSLNTQVWAVNGAIGDSAAPLMFCGGGSPISPVLSFSATDGMGVGGANSLYEFSTIVSQASFTLPFTAQAVVLGSSSYGNTFVFALTTSDASQGVSVLGNLNPNNYLYYGMHLNTGPGSASTWTSQRVYASPSINVWYTLNYTVDASGSASATVSSSQGTTLATATAQIGTGPFYVLLGQGEGWPVVSGPNQAYWQSVTVAGASTDSIGTLSAPAINGLQVDINGACGPNATYIKWNWGDGSTDTGWFPHSHTYASSGNYSITVTAYFIDGGTASTSETVNVYPGELVGGDELTITAGLRGSVSYGASVGSGTVSSNSSQMLYLALDDDLTLTATPSSGYDFGWAVTSGITFIEGTNTTSPNITVVVTSNSSILANFGVSSSTLVVCSPNPVPVGSPVTCITTVFGSGPTGNVTWSTSSSTGSFSQSVCTLSSGNCSTTYTDNNTGYVTISASYSGDSNNLPSSGSTTLTVFMNVTTGTNITLTPTNNLELTFANVTAAGIVIANETLTVPARPLDLAGEYCNIKVTAGFSGNVTVSLSFYGSSMTTQQKSNLTMMQYTPIPGDVAAPFGVVDMADVVTVLKAFGSTPGKPNWNPACDINQDGKVDMTDVVVVLENFGKTANWTNIITYVDTTNNIIYGNTTHFSFICIH
jgi:hypothetical protein